MIYHLHYFDGCILVTDTNYCYLTRYYMQRHD